MTDKPRKAAHRVHQLGQREHAENEALKADLEQRLKNPVIVDPDICMTVQELRVGFVIDTASIGIKDPTQRDQRRNYERIEKIEPLPRGGFSFTVPFGVFGCPPDMLVFVQETIETGRKVRSFGYNDGEETRETMMDLQKKLDDPATVVLPDGGMMKPDMLVYVRDASQEDHLHDCIEYDFQNKEDVLVSIHADPMANRSDPRWKGWQLEIQMVPLNTDPDRSPGAASYYNGEFGLFEYPLMDIWDIDIKSGWFVIEGITGIATRGDGWNTDDDFEIYHENIRPATKEEIDDHA